MSEKILILALLLTVGVSAYQDFYVHPDEIAAINAERQSEIDSLNEKISKLQQQLAKEKERAIVEQQAAEQATEQAPVAQVKPQETPEPVAAPEPPKQSRDVLISELRAYRDKYIQNVQILDENLRICNENIRKIDAEPYPNKSSFKPSQADIAKFEATQNQRKSPYTRQKAAIEAELIKQKAEMGRIEDHYYPLIK